MRAAVAAAAAAPPGGYPVGTEGDAEGGFPVVRFWIIIAFCHRTETTLTV